MTDDPRIVDNGGPAFPTVELAHRLDTPAPGMSLRDWFAGQALAGMLGTNEGWNAENKQIAQSAYEVADAMLACRKEAGR